MRQITRKPMLPYRGSKVNDPHNLQTEDTLQKDPFYEQLKYFFLILRAAGRLPYMRTKTGEFYCSIFSTSTLYTVFVVSALSYNIYSILFRRNFSKVSQYDKSIRFMHWSILFGPQVLSIIYTPLETLKIVTFMNNWRIFNVNFIKITGSPLPTCFLYSIPLAIIASVVTYGTLLLMLLTVLPKDLVIMNIITFYLNLILMLYWYFVCLYICYTGKIFSDSLVKILKKNPNGQDISKFRHLWLELRELSLELPNSMTMALTAVFVSLFILFVLYIYEYFQTLLIPHGKYKVYHHMMVIFVTFSVFIGYSDGAYNVQQKLGVDIMRAVMSCKLLSLKEEAHHEVLFIPYVEWTFCLAYIIVWAALACDFIDLSMLLRDQFIHNSIFQNRFMFVGGLVELLLDVIEYNPPTMTLSGFLNIDRYLLTQIISMAATYMVVLLQFKLFDL